MKIDNFIIDVDKASDELNQLSDTLKYLLYENDEKVFDQFEFDKEYLEPSLFYYFFKNKEQDQKLNYRQYIVNNYIGNLPLKFDIDIDCFKNARIPEAGFVVSPKQTSIIYDNEKYYFQNGEQLHITEDRNLKNSNIRISSVVPNILHQYHPSGFEHNIIEIQKDVLKDLNKAYDNLSKYSPEFTQLLNMTTKEISVFNLPKTPSFASINYFGTSFINIHERIHNDILFMDEIAHQSGHSIFTLLTRDSDSYFLFPPQTLLKNFTGFSGEGRTLYGAFHSMFTLCTIIHTLNAFLLNGNPNEYEKIELYGRIGFYLDKLIYDVEIISKLEIFTPKGKQIYQMLAENMTDYQKLENGIFLKFNYDNQDYLFSPNRFLIANQSILHEAQIS